MKDWFRGPRGGLLAFVIITGLVAGGLGWATAAALRVEREQLAERAEAEHVGQLRLALWRLDSQIAPVLAREHNRPFNHYSAVFAPLLAFNNSGACQTPGTVLEMSPLLSAELPDWMLLHFQINSTTWESPQAPSPSLMYRLPDPRLLGGMLPNVTEERRSLLMALTKTLPPDQLLELARERTEPATLHDTTLMLAQTQASQGGQNNDAQQQIDHGNEANSQRLLNPQTNSVLPNQMPYQGQGTNSEYNMRSAVQSRFQEETLKKALQRVPKDQVRNNFEGNGENWMTSTPNVPASGPPGKPGKKDPKVVVSAEATVNLSPMVPLWVKTSLDEEQLMLLRMVRIGDKDTCQGILLDWQRLQQVLVESVTDLFPDARLVPVREPVPEQLERTMTALPFELDPGPVPAPADPGWTGLRMGLTLAWSAAGMALLAGALGGWSLINLSERRIRFVSAVTHELRTPLTTLRLYVDMLLGGLVRDEKQRQEYLQTLNAEADRLNRLVSNVLDFSRLEKHQPAMTRTPLPVTELLAQVDATWRGRCHDAGKELLLENNTYAETVLCTDPALLQQVLGNLLDNACKYSRGADDSRLWLRVRQEKGRIVIEVEDRGPGVPAVERRSIFRAFRRGRQSDVTGGVGLGLALALRWTGLLGGRVVLRPPGTETGACFQVWLPM